MTEKKANDYWVKRARLREKESALKGKELQEEVKRQYEKASQDIRDKIASFYVRYANENGLSVDEAKKVMNKAEFQQWKKSLEEYVDEINQELDSVKAAELKARLDALSYNSQIARLNALNEEISMALNSLAVKTNSVMSDGFKKVFEDNYIKQSYDLIGKIGFRYKQLNDDIVKDVLSYPWSGANFSERLWKNKDALAFNLKEIISQGIIKGTALPQMGKELSEKMGQSFKACERLIETETTHFHAESNFRTYKSAGVEYYQYIAEHELTTCSKCASLDNEVFKVSERNEGVNAEPMHPNCHCTTISYDPEEKEDYINSGLKPPPDREGWREWYDMQVAEKGDETVKTETKIIKNKTADEKQYEKYKEVLGKENVPKNLAEFQELKYNKLEEWDKLKHNYRIVNSYEANSGKMSVNKILELDEKAFNIKTTQFTGKAKNRGNIAVMELDGQFKIANSQLDKNTEPAYINFKGTKEDLVLKSGSPKFDVLKVGTHIRDVDSEAKLFEYAANIAEDGNGHTINLLSERSMCESCLGVMKQFKAKYPKVTVNAVSNKASRAAKNGNKPWKYRKNKEDKNESQK